MPFWNAGMMKSFTLGLFAGGGLVLFGMQYHLLRTQERYIVISRVHQPPLRSAYVDVREWSPQMWQQFPELSEAVNRSGHRDLLVRDGRRMYNVQSQSVNSVGGLFKPSSHQADDSSAPLWNESKAGPTASTPPFPFQQSQSASLPAQVTNVAQGESFTPEIARADRTAPGESPSIASQMTTVSNQISNRLPQTKEAVPVQQSQVAPQGHSQVPQPLMNSVPSSIPAPIQSAIPQTIQQPPAVKSTIPVTSAATPITQPVVTQPVSVQPVIAPANTGPTARIAPPIIEPTSLTKSEDSKPNAHWMKSLWDNVQPQAAQLTRDELPQPLTEFVNALESASVAQEKQLAQQVSVASQQSTIPAIEVEPVQQKKLFNSIVNQLQELSFTTKSKTPESVDRRMQELYQGVSNHVDWSLDLPMSGREPQPTLAQAQSRFLPTSRVILPTARPSWKPSFHVAPPTTHQMEARLAELTTVAENVDSFPQAPRRIQANHQ